MNLNYSLAAKQLINCDIEVCEQYFLENNYFLEAGYCKLLTGKTDEAEIFFQKVKDVDVRANWAFLLIQFIRLYVKVLPSYFQIRNFLEIDINLLIKAGQSEFVENIINGADLFYQVNQESYKFIARVLMNNDFYALAFTFLEKAKYNFYFDPEMHYMMAQCYLYAGDQASAYKSASHCLDILPGYYPAKRIIDNINKQN